MFKTRERIADVPWTTVIGIIMGAVTTCIIYYGITDMAAYGRDYNGFSKEFLSITLVVESLVFGIFISYKPKIDNKWWNDSDIVYWIAAMVVPFTLFFTISGLVSAWMEFEGISTVRFTTCMATFIAYSSIYAISLKTARTALVETLDKI